MISHVKCCASDLKHLKCCGCCIYPELVYSLVKSGTHLFPCEFPNIFIYPSRLPFDILSNCFSNKLNKNVFESSAPCTVGSKIPLTPRCSIFFEENFLCYLYLCHVNPDYHKSENFGYIIAWKTNQKLQEIVFARSATFGVKGYLGDVDA